VKYYKGVSVALPSNQLIGSPQDAGRLIQSRRRDVGMTQELLSSISGIAQPNLSKIERGWGANLETYLRLFGALGVDLIGQPRS